MDSMIPTSWQHKFRDSGGLQALLDWGTVILATVLMVETPSLLLDFINQEKRMKFYQYGSTSRHIIQIASTSSSLSTSTCFSNHSRATILIHGGAWGSGRLWMYRLIAYNYAKLLRSEYVVLIGYPVYPTATVLEQKDCIIEAIQFLNNNPDILKSQNVIHSLPTKIIVDHSSGANIVALALFECYQKNLSFVDAFIGLSGVYDIATHSLFEKDRGVHEISPMQPAASGKQNFDQCSPLLIAQSILLNEGTVNSKSETINSASITTNNSNTKLISDNISNNIENNKNMNSNEIVNRLSWMETVNKKLPICCFIHGLRDTTVPASASQEFETCIRKFNGPVVSDYIEADHIEVILDPMCEFQHSRATNNAGTIVGSSSTSSYSSKNNRIFITRGSNTKSTIIAPSISSTAGKNTKNKQRRKQIKSSQLLWHELNSTSTSLTCQVVLTFSKILTIHTLKSGLD